MAIGKNNYTNGKKRCNKYGDREDRWVNVLTLSEVTGESYKSQLQGVLTGEVRSGNDFPAPTIPSLGSTLLLSLSDRQQDFLKNSNRPRKEPAQVTQYREDRAAVSSLSTRWWERNTEKNNVALLLS